MINFLLYLHREVERTVLSLENGKITLTGNFLLVFCVLVLRFDATCYQWVSVLVSGYFVSDIEVAFPCK